MKILLSNKYYYPRGGDCIYTIELEKLLKEKGHEVAVFSMQHTSNLNSEYSGYFPSETDFNKKSLNNILNSIVRPFGSPEVRRNFNRLINDFKPDIVHLNNIHSQLSPVLAQIAHEHKIPVVWTLHDYKLLCPRYDCMRDGKSCELCFSDKHNVVRYKCIKNSLVASLLSYAESIAWHKNNIGRFTSLFICPSVFMFDNMLRGGFKAEQLTTLSNFINNEKLNGIQNAKEDYYCYIGRLSSEKGVETLLKAAIELPYYVLKIIGTGPLDQKLKAKYGRGHIEFLGYKNWDILKPVLEGSKCMVVPSECYENNPLSVLESLCLGTPVIGAKIGGIPELIDPGVNGLLFESGNVVDLQDKISFLWQNSHVFNSPEIANDARVKYSSDNYYEKLFKIYNNLLYH
jgi:glycosyltransferase involved in cell wall biosynthesis